MVEVSPSSPYSKSISKQIIVLSCTEDYIVRILSLTGDMPNLKKKRINLLYDDTTRHYHVITNVTAAMAKRHVCRGCGKGCESDITHKCEEICSDCMSVPPCAFSTVRIPCEACNRTFRSQSCFDKHKTNKLRRKTVCAQKKNCAKCDSLLTQRVKHECFIPYCVNC